MIILEVNKMKKTFLIPFPNRVSGVVNDSSGMFNINILFQIGNQFFFDVIVDVPITRKCTASFFMSA